MDVSAQEFLPEPGDIGNINERVFDELFSGNPTSPASPRQVSGNDRGTPADLDFGTVEQLFPSGLRVDDRRPGPPSIHQARAQLFEAFAIRGAGQEDVLRLQTNFRLFEDRLRRDSLADSEVAQTYREVRRILESPPASGIAQDQLMALAQSTLAQAAMPTSVNQGAYATCIAAAIESRLYHRHPGEAARIVADLSTRGRVTFRDGTTVAISPESMAPPPANPSESRDGSERSHASQLFQTAALNLHYQNNHYAYRSPSGERNMVPPGGIRYETNSLDAGRPGDRERLIDTTTSPVTLAGGRVSISDRGVQELNNRITGETTSDTVIVHSRDLKEPGGLTAILTAAELEARLVEAAGNDRFPIILGVHSGNLPWYLDSGAGLAGGSDGGHVVTVLSYEAGPPPRVAVDNFWGNHNDRIVPGRSLTVEELYLSMLDPTSDYGIRELEQAIMRRRLLGDGRVDAAREFQLLRARYNVQQKGSPYVINSEEFDRRIAQEIESAARRFQEERAQSRLDPDEFHTARVMLENILNNELPGDRRWALLLHARNSGFFDDRDFFRIFLRSVKNPPEFDGPSR